MKSTLLVSSLTALAIGCLMPAQGQSAATKVGVINIQSALVGTKDGQKAVAELQIRQAPKQKDLEKKQSDIRALQESLNRGGNAMSDTARQDLTRTIDEKTKQFNRDLEDARTSADEDEKSVLNKLGQRMMVVIDKFARDNGYSVILDVSNPQTPVLYASNTVDITKDIITLYDQNGGVSGSSPGSGTSSNSVPPSSNVSKPAAPAAPHSAPPAKK
ncbi:MAG: OmpH family outer membrane protein [Bryobacteraceae bacterium]